jgi:hypothetical protein
MRNFYRKIIGQISYLNENVHLNPINPSHQTNPEKPEHRCEQKPILWIHDHRDPETECWAEKVMPMRENYLGLLTIARSAISQTKISGHSLLVT